MSTTPESDVAAAGGALQTLIHQFSDPLSCYRELVQNALDAGSMVVNIRVTYVHSKKQAQISVEDSGTGMTSHVIDTQLTRLFASKKDGDLTRIGKFGIGFVSVFALQPERLTLETSCDGESWLVEFLDNGEFERRPLTEPREGTLIRVFKSMSFADFQRLRDDSRKTILYWCKHVGGEILFNDEELNREFTVDAPVVYRWQEPDTEIVLGYPKDGQSFTGFYNQGLTLMESQTEHIWPGLAIKANSRFLEHTLTRDNIVMDENFEKVVRRIHEMVEHELPTYLLSQLGTKSEREPYFSSLLNHYGWLCTADWKCDRFVQITGEADSENWTAIPSKHGPGFMSMATPSLAAMVNLPDEVAFLLSVPMDNYTASHEKVATLSIFDRDENTTLCELPLHWDDFRPHYGLHRFTLSFSMRPAQNLDFRTQWEGKIPLTLHGIELRRKVTRQLNFTADQLTLPIFRTPLGEGVSLKQIREAQKEDRLWFVQTPCTLAHRLLEAEQLVICAKAGSLEWQFASLVLDSEPRRAELEWVAPVEDVVPASWKELWPLVQELSRQWGAELRDFRWARPDCEQDWFALVLPQMNGYHSYDRACGSGAGEGPRIFVLNQEHELTPQLLALAAKEPQMAAYLVCKQFLSQSQLTPEMDAKLANRAWGLCHV